MVSRDRADRGAGAGEILLQPWVQAEVVAGHVAQQQQAAVLQVLAGGELAYQAGAGEADLPVGVGLHVAQETAGLLRVGAVLVAGQREVHRGRHGAGGLEATEAQVLGGALGLVVVEELGEVRLVHRGVPTGGLGDEHRLSRLQRQLPVPVLVGAHHVPAVGHRDALQSVLVVLLDAVPVAVVEDVAADDVLLAVLVVAVAENFRSAHVVGGVDLCLVLGLDGPGVGGVRRGGLRAGGGQGEHGRRGQDGQGGGTGQDESAQLRNSHGVPLEDRSGATRST